MVLNNEILVSIAIGAGICMLMAIYSILVWYTKKFYLKENMLYYQTGIISKKVLTLSKDNISTIDIGQSFLQRIIGIYRLKVDSGSTTLGKAEVDIVLNKERIDYIKSVIETTTDSKIQKANTVQDKERSKEFKCTNRELFILALTKNKLGLIVTLIISSFTFLDDLLDTLKLDISKYVDQYFNIEDVIKKSMGELVVFSIQLFTVIYILSFIVSVIVTFIRYYNFIIYEQNNKLNIQYGLISLKKYTLPIKNIQAIKLKQTLINQWFKQYKVEVVTAGYGDEEKEEAIFYPLTDKVKLNILIDTLIPNFNFENIELKYPPKKAMKRFFIFPVIFSIVIFLVISFIFHKAVFIFMFMPIIIFSCYIEYRNNTMGYDESIFYGSFGAFSKTSIIIKMNSVQSITETTNYFQRKMGVCNYKIDFYSSKLIDILAIKNMHRYHFRGIEKNIEF
jgi:putative membrane protein